jgi:hypothetical protein
MQDPVLRVLGSEFMNEEKLLFEYRSWATNGYVPHFTDKQVLRRLRILVEEGHVTLTPTGYRAVSNLPPPGPPDIKPKPKDDTLF